MAQKSRAFTRASKKTRSKRRHTKTSMRGARIAPKTRSRKQRGARTAPKSRSRKRRSTRRKTRGKKSTSKRVQSRSRTRSKKNSTSAWEKAAEKQVLKFFKTGRVRCPKDEDKEDCSGSNAKKPSCLHQILCEGGYTYMDQELARSNAKSGKKNKHTAKKKKQIMKFRIPPNGNMRCPSYCADDSTPASQLCRQVKKKCMQGGAQRNKFNNRDYITL